MKKILSTLVVLISYFSYAQQKGDIVIEWTERQEFVIGEQTINIPQFTTKNFEFDSWKKEIFFKLKIPQSAAVDENSLQITNIIYESIPASQLGALSATAIPTQHNAKIQNLQARDKLSVLLSLSPIIKDGSGFKKIKSFTYSFNTSTSRVILPNTVSAITNSVLANGEWFRFFVTKSGAYLINKVFLQQLGINTNSIDPRKIKIYGNGGRMVPLKNSTFYPDDLAENAIQVTGESDGVFNDNDFIVFYAEGVDNYNEESDTNNNLYTDKSYYYINVQGAEGKRIQTMLQPSTAGTPITVFDDFRQ